VDLWYHGLIVSEPRINRDSGLPRSCCNDSSGLHFVPILQVKDSPVQMHGVGGLFVLRLERSSARRIPNDLHQFPNAGLALSHDTNHDALPLRESARGGTQFGLRGMFVLTTASAYWIWLLSDLRNQPVFFAIFAAITIVFGIGGHIVYTYLITWRGTVVVGLLVLPAVIFCGLCALFGAGSDGFVILAIPIHFFLQQDGPYNIWHSLLYLMSVMILTAAHPIKPCLLTAIISAMGISVWYGMACLIASEAG
jgi:hypothetical protein